MAGLSGVSISRYGIAGAGSAAQVLCAQVVTCVNELLLFSGAIRIWVTLQYFSSSLVRRILLLALPLIISNITVPLVGLINTALVGHLSNPHYLVALSVGVGIFNFIFQIFFFMRMSTVGLVAQLGGEGNYQRIYNILVQYLAFALMAGLALVILMPLIARFAEQLYTISADTLPLFHTYLYIRMLAAPAVISMFLFLGFFVGIQQVRHALYLSLLINFLTMVLGAFSVLQLHMNLAGIALADVLAQYAGMAYALFFIIRFLRRKGVRFRQVQLIHQLAYLFRLNTDTLVRTLALVGAIFMFSVFSSYLGPEILVVNTILLQIQSLTALALDGFANAAETLSGQYARQPQKLGRVLTNTAIASVITALLITVVYIVAFPFILGFLTSDPQVIDTAYQYQLFVYLLPIISVWCFWLDGVFTGLLRTREMRNSMLISVVIYMSAAYAATYLNNYALCTALLLLFVSRGATLAHRLYRQPGAAG